MGVLLEHRTHTTTPPWLPKRAACPPKEGTNNEQTLRAPAREPRCERSRDPWRIVRNVPATIRTDDAIADLLDIEHGVVFQATEVDDEWAHVAAELRSAFDATKPAAIDGQPVVYVVSSDALLGRTGAGNAMVATGLLSAARTLAAELRRDGVPVNTPADVIVTWIGYLLERGGPTGELVQLGGSQIGKALP